MHNNTIVNNNNVIDLNKYKRIRKSQKFKEELNKSIKEKLLGNN